MLKAAFKEEREARLTCEIELNNLIQKYEQQSAAFEDFKDKNLQLYERNIELEEKCADYRQIQRANENPISDSEHMKEMLGTQNLLREEMKEKEFFKKQAKDAIEKMIQMEDEFKQREMMQQEDSSNLRQQISLLEKKTQTLWD